MSETAWSRSPASEVGAYWFKASEDGNAELVFVRLLPIVVNVTGGMQGTRRLCVDTVVGAKPVEQLAGFWAAPLLPPTNVLDADPSGFELRRETGLPKMLDEYRSQALTKDSYGGWYGALQFLARAAEERLAALEARCTNTPN
jgi:hypothetical protein